MAIGGENMLEADLARATERRSGMAVRQVADHGEGITLGRNDCVAPQHAAKAFDVGARPVRKIAQSALTNLAARTVALAQQG